MIYGRRDVFVYPGCTLGEVAGAMCFVHFLWYREILLELGHDGAGLVVKRAHQL